MCLQEEQVDTTGEQRSQSASPAIPPLVLRLSTTAGAEQSVTVVAWCSQGTESKLAAVVGGTVAVFGLEQHISSIVQQSPAVHSQPGQTPACQAQHPHLLVALSWTQEGDGLLSSDAQGTIVMWMVSSTKGGSQQLTQAWIGGSSTIVQPQTILTAGANVLAPSASACPGSKHVTIWWPEEIQHSSDLPGKTVAPAKEESAMVAVAEQLRHPVGVVAAQWSPGSLQHGTYSTHGNSTADILTSSVQSLFHLSFHDVFSMLEACSCKSCHEHELMRNHHHSLDHASLTLPFSDNALQQATQLCLMTSAQASSTIYQNCHVSHRLSPATKLHVTHTV